MASSEPDKGSPAWTSNLAMTIACIKLRQHILLVELGSGRASRLHHVVPSRRSTGMDQDLEQVGVEEVAAAQRAAWLWQPVPASRPEGRRRRNPKRSVESKRHKDSRPMTR